MVYIYFYLLKLKPRLSHPFSHPPFLYFWQPPFYSLYLWSWFSFSSFIYEREYTIFVFLCLTHFTPHNVLELHSCCGKWQDFFLFYGQIISLVYPPHVLYPSPISRHLGWFHVLSITNNAQWTWESRYLFKLLFLFSSQKLQEVWLQYGSFILIFKEPSYCSP